MLTLSGICNIEYFSHIWKYTNSMIYQISIKHRCNRQLKWLESYTYNEWKIISGEWIYFCLAIYILSVIRITDWNHWCKYWDSFKISHVKFTRSLNVKPLIRCNLIFYWGVNFEKKVFHSMNWRRSNRNVRWIFKFLHSFMCVRFTFSDQ